MSSDRQVEFRVERAVPLAAVTRVLQQWTLEIVRADDRTRVDKVDTSTVAKIDVGLPAGKYVARLSPSFGSTLTVRALGLGVGIGATAVDLAARLLQRFIGDDAWALDSKEFEVVPDGDEPLVVELSGDGRTPRQRAVQRASFIGTHVLAGGLLAGFVVAVLALLVEFGPPIRLVVGGVIAALCLASSLMTTLTALGHLEQPAADRRTKELSRVDVAVAVFGDIVGGVGLLVVACSAMACVLLDLQAWGALLSESGEPVAALDLFNGLLWHAADTLPLVDPQKAWNWAAPWQLQPDSPLAFVVGVMPFLVQALVAVGIARVVTKLLVGK